jgi:hypothetical protein
MIRLLIRARELINFSNTCVRIIDHMIGRGWGRGLGRNITRLSTLIPLRIEGTIIETGINIPDLIRLSPCNDLLLR